MNPADYFRTTTSAPWIVVILGIAGSLNGGERIEHQKNPDRQMALCVFLWALSVGHPSRRQASGFCVPWFRHVHLSQKGQVRITAARRVVYELNHAGTRRIDPFKRKAVGIRAADKARDVVGTCGSRTPRPASVEGGAELG